MARVKAGWVTLQASAARVKFRLSQTARKYRIWCISMGENIPSRACALIDPLAGYCAKSAGPADNDWASLQYPYGISIKRCQRRSCPQQAGPALDRHGPAAAISIPEPQMLMTLPQLK